MKIALIDTGIDNKFENVKLEHFCVEKGHVKSKSKAIKESHGTECCKEIINHCKCKELKIIDFNVWNDGNIEIKNIVAAINRAIKEQVTLINISLGVTENSIELADACKEALMNNIIIVSAASHRNTVSFPADYRTVLSVNVDQNQSEKIKLVDDNSISISMRDYIIDDNGEKFDFSSSSMASARVTGLLANELEGDFVQDNLRILNKKYGIKFSTNNSSKTEKIEEKPIINGNVAVVLYPQKQLEKLKENRLTNVVAYFDFESGTFKGMDNDEVTDNFDSIFLVNTMYNDVRVPKGLEEKYKEKRIYYLGNFIDVENAKLFRKYDSYTSDELSILEKPVIAVASLCSECNKNDIHYELYKSLTKDNVQVEAISNNPLGIVQGMNVFEFPQEIKFPNIVYEINQYMYLNETNKDMDIWLINIGGAIGPLNGMNLYKFGKLADAYLSASNVDILVLCVNPSVDIEHLRYEMGFLYKNGVEKIYLVLSNNDIDGSTTDYRDGVQTYQLDSTKYTDSIKYLQDSIGDKVFSMEEAKSGLLYKEIINDLT